MFTNQYFCKNIKFIVCLKKQSESETRPFSTFIGYKVRYLFGFNNSIKFEK